MGDKIMLIKKENIGNTQIEIYDDFIPKNKEDLKKNIENLYNVVNEVAKNIKKEDLENYGIFYDQEHLKKAKVIEGQ